MYISIYLTLGLSLTCEGAFGQLQFGRTNVSSCVHLVDVELPDVRPVAVVPETDEVRRVTKPCQRSRDQMVQVADVPAVRRKVDVLACQHVGSRDVELRTREHGGTTRSIHKIADRREKM